MSEAGMTHIYAWGNNSMRKLYKGNKCRILITGSMNTCLVEFENGDHLNTSRRALRKIKDAGKIIRVK